MSSDLTNVLISCHCGAAKQTVTIGFESQKTAGPQDTSIDHSYDYRHNTGLLCASYAPIQVPNLLNNLVAYPEVSPDTDSVTTRHYFCSTCGCHVFRRRHTPTERESWGVATGVIAGRVGADGQLIETDDRDLLRVYGYTGVAETKDGGLAPFIHESVGNELPTPGPVKGEAKGGGEDVLEAHCHCKNVQFSITRPDASSHLPRSNFPDLITPYATSLNQEYTNPQDEKWWLRPRSKDDSTLTRYLAGTCACRSCRLISGFEIQVWAFIPRSNIFFVPPTTAPSSTLNTIPLDFTTLPSGILKSYESSPGVQREFCPRCGATVSWHDRWRPELIDVSIGLLDAPEGALAGNWLDWWHGRVSFEEDADNGRVGGAARWATGLIGKLAEGLRSSENRGREG